MNCEEMNCEEMSCEDSVCEDMNCGDMSYEDSYKTAKTQIKTCTMIFYDNFIQTRNSEDLMGHLNTIPSLIRMYLMLSRLF